MKCGSWMRIHTQEWSKLSKEELKCSRQRSNNLPQDWSLISLFIPIPFSSCSLLFRCILILLQFIFVCSTRVDEYLLLSRLNWMINDDWEINTSHSVQRENESITDWKWNIPLHLPFISSSLNMFPHIVELFFINVMKLVERSKEMPRNLRWSQTNWSNERSGWGEEVSDDLPQDGEKREGQDVQERWCTLMYEWIRCSQWYGRYRLIDWTVITFYSLSLRAIRMMWNRMGLDRMSRPFFEHSRSTKSDEL